MDKEKENRIDESCPDSIMLNPDYLKSLQDIRNEYADSDDEVSQRIKDWIDYQMNRPENQTNSSFIRQLVEYLSNPENSSAFREHFFFNTLSREKDDQIDDAGEFKITIPIFSTSF